MRRSRMSIAVAGACLIMGAAAGVEQAVTPGPLLASIEVMTMSGQTNSGVSVKQKAPPDERATPAVSPAFGLGCPMFEFGSLFPTATNSTYDRTPSDICKEDLCGGDISPVGVFSAFRSTDLRTEPNGGSPLRSRRNILAGFANEKPNRARLNPTAHVIFQPLKGPKAHLRRCRGSENVQVAMQTILGAGGKLATGSIIAGAFFALVGGAMVDAATTDTAKESPDSTCDDDNTCGTEAKTSKWLFFWGVLSTMLAHIWSVYAVLLKLKEFDETFQYVRRRALDVWQGMSGLVGFLLSLDN